MRNNRWSMICILAETKAAGIRAELHPGTLVTPPYPPCTYCASTTCPSPAPRLFDTGAGRSYIVTGTVVCPQDGAPTPVTPRHLHLDLCLWILTLSGAVAKFLAVPWQPAESGGVTPVRGVGGEANIPAVRERFMFNINTLQGLHNYILVTIGEC